MMSNQSNVNRQNSQNSTNILQDLQSCDFVTSFPASRKLPIDTSNENHNVDHLNSQNSTNVLQDLQSCDFVTSFPASRKLPVDTSNENDNVDRQNSQNPTNILQELQTCDFVTSFPGSWKLPVDTSNENHDFDQLKLKINGFLREHPNILPDIKDYLYDEILTFTLKRALKLPFDRSDMDKTEKLISRFFIEHEENFRIIYNYFVDDIKLFLRNHRLLSVTAGLCTNNATVKCTIFTAFMLLLKAKGARFITSRLYCTEVAFSPKKNLPQQSTLRTQSISDLMKFLPILGCVCILCGIFGWEIFRLVLYFCIGVVILLFFIYLLLRSQMT